MSCAQNLLAGYKKGFGIVCSCCNNKVCSLCCSTYVVLIIEFNDNDTSHTSSVHKNNG